jgi:predicted dehydrogenase
MDKIRCAVIGMGRSGKDIHARFISEELSDRFELVAVVDPLPKRRENAKTVFGCDTYADYSQLFDRNDIDLVIIATPTNLHCKISVSLMESGFDVICDKPAANTVSEIDKMIETKNRTGKRLMIFQNWALGLGTLKIEEIVKSGVLGRIVQTTIHMNDFRRRWDWQTVLKFGGGNIFNKGSHAIDFAMHLLDIKKVPEKVYAVMDIVNAAGDADDYTKIVFETENCKTVDIELSNAEAFSDQSIRVQGENGSLLCIERDQVKWRYLLSGENQKHELDTTPIVNDEGEPAYCKETIKWHDEEWKMSRDNKDFASSVKIFYDNVWNVIRSSGDIRCTPELSKIQLEIIEKCLQQNPRFKY